jgi:hypothetical protein
MKTIGTLSCLLTVVAVFAPKSHATDFVFSSFQCDPSECIEQTVPVTQGSAFVSFNATCTGGAVGEISGSASIVIGVPTACNAPYVAYAQVQQSTQTLLDDFGCAYDLSSETQIAKIFNSAGTLVFDDEAGVDCQGGTFGPTNNGLRPC